MRHWHLLASTLLATSLATPALAEEVASDGTSAVKAAKADSARPDAAKPAAKAFSTGVAKGRDLLDTAISASSLDEADLPKLGVTSVVGVIGNLPGLRGETAGIDGYSSLTVRGLPMSADGAKFIQIQEDGLPVLEFGDIHLASSDAFLRPDLGLSQVQVIRGGSASTFASNSPGGVINFISKTGETEGGALQIASGLDHDLNRVDFEYGAPVGGGWRFHVGGFYREGEGLREVGYKGVRGGQVKFNVTRQFANGYFRINAKYLDDRQPNYSAFPLLVSGTDASPQFANLPGTDARRDSLRSRYITSLGGVDQANNPQTLDLREGIRGIMKSIGAELQLDIAGWTVSNKFRFAGISGRYNEEVGLLILPADAMTAFLGGPGAVLSYAGGPKSGQVVTDPKSLNGNGVLTLPALVNAKLNSLNNITNDLRASRVWTVGAGKLTTTAGVYASSQDVDTYWGGIATVLEGVATKGTATYFNVTTAGGVPVTDNGIKDYGLAVVGAMDAYHRHYDLNYRILAPYASVNYQVGKLSVGGSLRFDHGKVTGQIYGGELGGNRVSTAAIDLDRNGVITAPEQAVAILPLRQPGNVDYAYNYVSYSIGANYRIAEPLSVFARFSRGGRAAAERVLFSPQHDPATGALTNPSDAYAVVKQAEGGFKLRHENFSVFLTGFWASTTESGFQVGADSAGKPIVINYNRGYSAKGAELEGELRHGPFSLALGATYVKSSIDRDTGNAALNGNRPRHQPELFFNVRPQFERGKVTVGATINGTTSSFAQDTNILKQPGYVLVNPFLMVRPVERLQLGLSAYNIFDKLAIINVSSGAIPATGIVNAQALNGRRLTASVRLSF